LAEALGSMPRHKLESQVALLDKTQRKDLRALGVRIGRETVFLPTMVKPAQAALRAFLWCLANGRKPLAPPPPGRVSVPVEKRLPAAYWEQVGYRRFGGLALRIDMVERIAAKAWDLVKSNRNGFGIEPDLLSLAGCGVDDMAAVLKGLGFRGRLVDGEMRFRPPRRPAADAKRTASKLPAKPVDPHSPFAKLQELVRA